MGITCRDQSTPVFLAQNISQHLSGTARTIGAALVGHFGNSNIVLKLLFPVTDTLFIHLFIYCFTFDYFLLGVRTFTPSSASNGFLYVGGPAVVLSLVAMAPDDSSLYAAVKVLHSVLETSSAMQQEMNRINGYKVCEIFVCWSSTVDLLKDINICCLQLLSLFMCVLVAASFPAEDEEQSGQPPNLSVGSASHKFIWAGLWIWLPTENTCFPSSAVWPRCGYPNFTLLFFYFIFEG